MSKGIFIRNQLLYWCSLWGVQNLTPFFKTWYTFIGEMERIMIT